MPKQPQEHRIEVRKTARYFTLDPSGPLKGVLYVIHGYRQLPGYFIRQFEPLTDLGIKVIAPEGLHRFYIEGYSGRVGASWMTKEARLDDINDYIHYLQDLHESMRLPKELPVSLLGFSQGGPTACRWLESTDFQFDQLILHSTVFPNDFDFQGQKEKLTKTSTYVIFGDSDQFADEATIASKLEWMKANGIHPNLLRFDGGHEVCMPQVVSVLNA